MQKTEILFSNFINSLKSPITKKNYEHALKQFMGYHHLTDYSELMAINKEEKIKEYVISLSQKNYSRSKFNIFFSAIKNFYEMNDVENIKWNKLRRFIGEEQPPQDNRRYKHEEIHLLVQSANMKLKAAIFLMASSGLRIGALPILKLAHLERRGDIYKINAYKDQKGKGQYYTFCTPEATNAIDFYLQFRERCGEKLSPNSPLFRADFDTDLPELARKNVRPNAKNTFITALRSELIKTGLREVDHVNLHKHKEVQLSHGFRKFFETMLVNVGIHETIIRKLTGHSDSSNLTQLYSKQTEEEMLLEYEKAIDALTINPENRLIRKVEKLEVEKTQYEKLAAQVRALEQKLA